MIYLTNTTERQTVYVPSARSDMRGPWKLILDDTLRQVELDDLEGPSATGYGYVRIKVSLPEGVNDGEYTYRLICGNTAVTSGLCRIGAIPIPVGGCYESVITYKTYNGGN